MNIIKLPGMIDVHVHFRDPGATQKEDFYTGTCSALAGGVTLVFDMPNNPTPTISYKSFKEKLKIAQTKAVCDFGLNFGASQLDNTSEFARIIPLVSALKLYMDETTGTLLVEDEKLLEKIFAKWESVKPIMIHAEEKTLVKALKILKKFPKRHIHFCHVSLAEEVQLIKRAKEQGFKVTAESTPHHLFLSENDQKKLGPFGVMKPPLRSVKDVKALWKGLKNGAIDIVATDHAPHTISEKQSAKPPYGVPGVETALPLMLSAVHEKRLKLAEVIKLYHENPRRIFKIPKQKATWIEVDLSKKWQIKNSELHTKCGWSPFSNWEVYGKVKRVVLRGKNVFEGGKVLVKGGFGRKVTS